VWPQFKQILKRQIQENQIKSNQIKPVRGGGGGGGGGGVRPPLILKFRGKKSKSLGKKMSLKLFFY
jgi:hypothetical protein